MSEYVCAQFCSSLFAIASLVFLIFGIFALVPAGPFVERNIEIGVTFIVLSCTGIFGIVLALFGAFVGYCIDTCITRVQA